MSKVLADPAALEEAAKWLEVHSSSSGSAEAFAADALREAIAQPAEAEGVEAVAWLHRQGNHTEAADRPLTEDEEARGWEQDELLTVTQHLTALSAVTAERDRLRDQVKVLQSDANSWQSGYDKGRRDGTKHRQSEVDQLRAQVERLTNCLHKANEQAEHFEREWYLRGDEVDGLRKDAERYRWLRKMHESRYGLTLTIARVGMMELTGWSGDDPDSVIDAAMAAKEA